MEAGVPGLNGLSAAVQGRQLRDRGGPGSVTTRKPLMGDSPAAGLLYNVHKTAFHATTVSKTIGLALDGINTFLLCPFI